MPVIYDQVAPPAQLAISLSDIQLLAERFEIPVANLRAVLEVESQGSGFLLKEPKPARPKILFEGHVFYRLTPKPVSKTRPDLSYPVWTKKFYRGGSAEWDRLQDAMVFDARAALMSASWGLGQVLGENFALAGCSSVERFVEENFSGEKEQFTHMLNFIKNTGLLDELKRGDWSHFAAGYNGRRYMDNKYDIKLAEAAKKYKWEI